MADKNYSVEINVGLNTDQAEKDLVDFKKELTKLLSGGGDLNFAIGGYGAGEDINQKILDSLRRGNKRGNERVAQQIADDLGDIQAEVIDLVKDNEGNVKRELNEVAKRYAEMLGINFVENIAEALGEPDFAVPLEGMSARRRQQATQDFMTSGQQVIYSPAAFISAIEKVSQQFPSAMFGQGAGRGIGLGLSRGQLNEPVFQSVIPELTDDILQSFQKLIHDSLNSENASQVGDYLRTQAQKVLDEIFERGFRAREATFASSGVSEGEEAAENLVTYADASARKAIAEAEEEFGLALGTLAKHIRIAGSQFMGFTPGVGAAGERVVSDPNMIRQIALGAYEDFMGKLVSVPTNAPDIMEQVFLNPAILMSGKEGVQKFFDGLSKLVVTGGQETGGPQQKLRELIASGRQLTAAFDSEFVDGLSNVITEASLIIKDDMDKFYNIFDLLQAPPASQMNIMAGAKVGPRNMAELRKRATELNYQDPLGAEEGIQNLKDFYPKLKTLIDLLNQIAEAGIPLSGANIQGADFSRIAKAIQNVNEAIQVTGVDLQPLAAPRGPYSQETLKKYPMAFPGHTLPDRGTVQDIQKMMKDASGAEVQMIKGLSEGSVKVGKLVQGLFDQFGKETQKLITLTKDGFTFEGDPAHTARADAKATAAIYDVLEKFSGAGRPPSTPLDQRRVSGIPEDGYEPFLKQLKGMNSVLSDMTEKEKQIFQARLQSFTTTKEQLAIYHKIEAVQEEIARIEETRDTGNESAMQDLAKLIVGIRKTRGSDDSAAASEISAIQEKIREFRGDSAARSEIDALEQLIVSYKQVGEANERRFASSIKFQMREDDFAGRNYQHARQRIDTSLEVADADKAQRDTIIRGIKDQVAAEKRLESQNKNLMNTWVTGRYALYDVGNAYESVSRQLAIVARRIFDVTNAYRSYETAFTSVERTIPTLAASVSGATEEMRSLQDAFIGMSEEMPLAFEQLSAIATLGAQMGISASGIVEFTKTVAQFSAITGISAETVAQKFGRIAELADVDYAEMNNLGSAVAFAGINAVATEAEILTLAESIAAVSNQAGLLPSEIVGISTALASTGIQAEQARGVFTRVFADIDRAVSKNGKELQAFASLSGMSAQEFSQAWGEDGASYEVFRALLGGLGATEDLTKAFDSLNIVETREINTLTRLAKNLNVVDQAVSDSNQSFESGAFLGDAFEKTVDNLDSKIQILKNNFNAFTEALSESTAGAMIVAIDVANDLLSTLKELAKNPLYQFATSFGLGLTAIAAAATFGVSAVTKLVAQIYAFRVAAINTANDATAISGFGAMFKQITGWGSGLIEIRKDLQSIAPATKGVITPVTLSLFGSFEEKQRKLLDSNILLLNSEKLGLSVARERADTINQMLRIRQAEIAQIVQSTTLTQAEKTARLQEIAAQRIYVTTTGQVVSGKISETEARKRNLIAINQETQAAVTAQAGVQSAGRAGLFSRILGIATGLGTVLSIVTLIGTAVGFVNEQFEKTKINLLESGGGLASLRDAIKQDTQEFQKLTAEQRKTNNEFITFDRQVTVSTTSVNKNAEAVANATGVGENFVEGNKLVTESVKTQTFAVGENTRAWFANAIMQDQNMQKLLKEYPNFFDDIKKFGLDFGKILNDIMSDPDMNINTYLDEQLSGTGGTIEKRLAEVRRELQQLKPVTGIKLTEEQQKRYDLLVLENTELTDQVNLLTRARAAIISIADAMKSGATGAELYNYIKDALGIIDDLGDEADETTDNLNNMADALRTVIDYAGDLSGVLSRVIELEFGKQMSRDDITKGWKAIRQSAEEAADAIEDANNSIKELTADRSILQYQLAVAERYGDELRAAKIRAELAKVNKDITDSEEKLAEAQDRASMTLVGNSDAALANRAALIDMVGTYQARIEMLAKLGMNRAELARSSEDLKKQFLAEAKALGFTENQLTDYAKLFDQFVIATEQTPRDVDIEVALGLDAAQQAINEFLAKNKDLGVDVDVNANTEDAEKELSVWQKKYRELTRVELKKINTLAADGSLNSWLTLQREFGAPKVTGITADAADRKIQDWLNQVRILAAPRIDVINTLAADGRLSSWLTLQRNFGAPEVSNITADAADRKIGTWLNQQRTLYPPTVGSVDHRVADMQINSWLNQSRKLSVLMQVNLDRSLIERQAQNMLNLARAYPVNSAQYNNYIDLYRVLQNVARGMKQGGFVSGPGTSTSDSIPAMLSNGEFVMNARSVRTYGVDFFNALNQQRVGFSRPASANNPVVAGGAGVVALSPEDRALLRAVINRPVTLYADNTKIAQSANAGNQILSQRGIK